MGEPDPELLPWYSPFFSFQYTKLFVSNIGEYCGYIVSDLALNLAIYEYYGESSPKLANVALGFIGLLNLLIQIPSIPLGGVIADDLPRKHVVTCAQLTQTVTNLIAAYLSFHHMLHPAFVYIISGVTTFARVVEKSARGALTANCVARSALNPASAINVVSADFGQVIAPFIFIWISTDTGETLMTSHVSAKEDQASLSVAFMASGVFHLVSGLCALAIIPLPLTVAQQEAQEASKKKRKKRAEGPFRHRMGMMLEGLRYILGHPLLPGLYLLDWGMTLLTFYRELFPMFVAQLWTDHLRYHLSFRQTVSLLTATNFIGGIVGGVATFYTGKVEKRKGRTVVIATVLYGLASIAFGLNTRLLFAFVTVFLCGAFDAVGASTRKQVIVVTVVDEMLGRATSGGSFAALVANSIGQIYVAGMSSLIGPGETLLVVRVNLCIRLVQPRSEIYLRRSVRLQAKMPWSCCLGFLMNLISNIILICRYNNGNRRRGDLDRNDVDFVCCAPVDDLLERGNRASS